jgi:hypothetical protein
VTAGGIDRATRDRAAQAFRAGETVHANKDSALCSTLARIGAMATAGPTIRPA